LIAACARFDAEFGSLLEGEARPSSLPTRRSAHRATPCWRTCNRFKWAARDLPQEEPSGGVWANIRQSLESLGAFGPSPCAQFSRSWKPIWKVKRDPLCHPRLECQPCGAMLADLQLIQVAAGTSAGGAFGRSLGPHPQSLESLEPSALSPCAQFSTELEAYLEGEARPFIATLTLRSSAPCGAMLADLQLIQVAGPGTSAGRAFGRSLGHIRQSLESLGAFGPSPARNFPRSWKPIWKRSRDPLLPPRAGVPTPAAPCWRICKSIREAPPRCRWKSHREWCGPMSAPGWRRRAPSARRGRLEANSLVASLPATGPLGVLASLVVVGRHAESGPCAIRAALGAPRKRQLHSSTTEVAELAPPLRTFASPRGF